MILTRRQAAMLERCMEAWAAGYIFVGIGMQEKMLMGALARKRLVRGRRVEYATAGGRRWVEVHWRPTSAGMAVATALDAS